MILPSLMVLFHFSKQYNIAFQQGKSISPIPAITIYHCWQIQTKIQNCCYDWEGGEGQTPTFLFWHFYIFIFIFSLTLNEFDFRLNMQTKISIQDSPRYIWFLWICVERAPPRHCCLSVGVAQWLTLGANWQPTIHLFILSLHLMIYYTIKHKKWKIKIRVLICQ